MVLILLIQTSLFSLNCCRATCHHDFGYPRAELDRSRSDWDGRHGEDVRPDYQQCRLEVSNRFITGSGGDSLFGSCLQIYVIQVLRSYSHDDLSAFGSSSTFITPAAVSVAGILGFVDDVNLSYLFFFCLICFKIHRDVDDNRLLSSLVALDMWTPD